MHNVGCVIQSHCWNCCHEISNCSLIVSCVCSPYGWFVIKPNKLAFCVTSIVTYTPFFPTAQANTFRYLYNSIPFLQYTHTKDSTSSLWRRVMAWWRHQMETFSALLAICAGNSPVTGEFPSQRPVTRSFDVFFHQCLNKQLSKQSWGWWFETLSRSLWRHRNVVYLMSL